eukprot:gene59754-79706_t
MLAIRLPENIETRLAQLAQETGLTKTALVREAILEHIDDLEDYYLAEARARKNRNTISLEDVERELGLIRLVGFLRTRVSSLTNPRDIGEALSGQRLGSYWKYRVGDWRIICDVQDQKILVRVLRIGNRRE